MYTELDYDYDPNHHYEEWHFKEPEPTAHAERAGRTSCLLFFVDLGLLGVYALVPGIPFWPLFAIVVGIALSGVLSAAASMTSTQFWLAKIYAMCGLIGNLCLPLWLLLSR